MQSTAVCAALLVGGAVLATLSAISHISEAHLRTTQPTSRLARLASMGTRRMSTPFAPQTAPTAGLARETTLRAAGLEDAASVPIVPLTAIALSLVAITANLFRGSEQPAAPSTVALPVAGGLSDDGPVTKSQAMDEVALALKADQARRKDFTPKQVILELQRGNARFWSGTPERPEVNAMERRALIIAQAPTVCVVSCADSRVPVEIVFDQGLGSVFVVRVAGNIIDSVAMGSIEFSVKYLGVKAVLVMGHEACGAVKGAFSMSEEDLTKAPKYLQTVLKAIKKNLDVSKIKKIQDNRAQDREAIVVNTTAQVKRLRDNPLIKERLESGSLLVCGAFYEITSGIVDFFTLDKNGLVVDV